MLGGGRKRGVAYLKTLFSNSHAILLTERESVCVRERERERERPFAMCRETAGHCLQTQTYIRIFMHVGNRCNCDTQTERGSSAGQHESVIRTISFELCFKTNLYARNRPESTGIRGRTK